MSFLIDTHCHLDLFKDIQLNKQEEDNSGIKTITVTNAPSFYTPNMQLFDGASNIRVALGLHPQLVEQYYAESSLFERLIKHARYIGEIGLDGSSNLKSSYSLQKRLFEKVLESAKIHGNKILTIHSRNAAKETIETIDRHLLGSNCKVMLHWYSGSISDLKTAILKGFYFSVNHKMVNSEKGKEIIRTIPNHLLLTETDAPFTFAGQVRSRLQSLEATITGIGIIKKKTATELREIVYNNFKDLLAN